MSMGTDAMVSPIGAAPPDRKSVSVEQWAMQGRVLLLGDGIIDNDERRILVDLFNEFFQRASNGPLGAGTTPPAEAQPAQSPQEMNQNVEPMYDDGDDDQQAVTE